MVWLTPELGWLLFNTILILVGGLQLRSSLQRQQLLAGELNRLKQVVRSIQEQQGALNQSTVGMGKRIRQIQGQVKEGEQRALFTHSDEASYQQAARLVSLGATANDLVENCGMARAEAELMVSMRRTA
ncbi:MAG: DUF2802 domain-containing protein [Oceanobacter sp.]